MKNLFLTFFEISVSTSVIVLALLIFSPLLNRRYASKWKYYIWVALAFRLLIPLNPDLPLRQVIIKVPEGITAPIITGTEIAIPIALQAEQKFAGATLLDFTAFLWFVVCLCFLFLHFFSFCHYKRQIIKKGAPAEDSLILSQLLRLRKDLRIKKKISVIKYSGAVSPMIIGFFRPVLVLPDSEYSQEEMFFILKHELIHLKRHDVCFKLLFITVNAIHWFNPLIYVMQKEAGIDMELSCDERVIQGTAYAVRKAYTETLLSALHKQYKKANSLTTEFYGGNQIMKKRFTNILLGSKKGNGLFLPVCAVSIAVFLGMTAGCSIMEPSPSETQRNNANVQTVPAQTPGSEESESDNTSNPGESLSEDGQQIKSIAEHFAAAYFSGDPDAVQSCLTDPYEWDSEVYAGLDTTGAGAINDLTLKGLTDIGEEEAGSVRVVSLEFRDSNYGDMLIHLTIEFVKQEDGWKIQFYGLEA